MYEFIFHTRSNGVIHRTDTRRYQNPIHESDWKEKHISKVIQEWGTPHGVIDDGTGSKIYIWQMPVLELLPREYHRIGSRLQTNGFHSISITGAYIPTSDTYELMFYTRPDGVIYKTFTKKELNTSEGFSKPPSLSRKTGLQKINDENTDNFYRIASYHATHYRW